MGLAKIGLEAVLDMTGFSRGKKEYTDGIDDMSGKTGKLSGLLSGAGKAIGIAGAAIGGAAIAGVGALGGFLAKSVGEAMSAQEAMVALQTVITSTGGAAGVTAEQAATMAGSLQMVTRFSDEEIMAAQTMLLQFETMNQETFPEATRLALDLAQRLNTGPREAAQLLGKALAEPGEGLLRLKQAGVTFTDAEEEMITAMYAAGDVAGAQAAIMDKLQASVGGAATAAGTTMAGQLDILKNQFSDILEQIGGAVLPSLQELAGALLDALGRPEVQAAIQNMAQWLATNLPIAIQTTAEFVTTQLVPAIKDIVTWVKEKLIPAVRDAAAWLKDPFITTIQDVVQWFKDTYQAIADVVQKVGDFITKIRDWGQAHLPEWLIGKSPPPLAKWLDSIAGSTVNATVGLSGIGGAVRGMPAMTQARGGGGGSVSNMSVGGDTIVQNISDPVSFYLAQALVQDRKRDRWASAMGVA